MDSSPASTRQPKIQNLGRYRLIAQLARGGMGVVYLALVRGPAGFNKLFVVKELKTDLAEDPQFISMFQEEARLAARLSHPNVVQTIEVGSENGRHFIAMEYLEGQPLHRLLSRAKKTGVAMSLEYQLHILVQALEGLHYAHSLADFDGTRLAIIHRDVSPHNIFVTYDGIVKVVDFGIAKALDTSQETGTGVLKGKIAFMAPEFVRGKTPDQRVDVFAAGVILWEALAGRRMWADKSNDMAILNALSEGAIPDVREHRPQVPKELALIADRATAADPDKRYASVAALQKDIEAFLKRPDALNVSARDIGQLVAELFEEEKNKIQSVIDAHIKVLRGVASAEYPQIDIAKLPPPSQPSGLNATPSGISLVDFTRPSTKPPGAKTSGTPVKNPYATDPSISRKVAAPPSKSRWLIPVALIVGLGIVAVAFMMRNKPAPIASDTTAISSSSAGAASASAAAASASSSAQLAADDRVQLTVNASPASARVAVDDGGLMATPFVSLMPRDGAVHHVRIEAPHFAAKLVNFTANADASIDVSLESQSARFLPVPAKRVSTPPPRPTATAAAQPISPPPAPTTDSNKPARPKRDIDTSDPYGGK